ncbi:hypothetical protein [Herbiconiux sp. YIM B11900]|uniref:hypothetical protein n=1 Tax=Herbiconiux sp. YIM B11900 TaxID=3404131 RepID=UPI003F8697FD
MPEGFREPMASLAALFSTPTPTSTPTDARPGGFSRRTVIGAAWAAPVIVASVAAPLAAASGGGQPDASFSWSEAEGIQGQSSLLTLTLPVGSPGIGSAATIVVTMLDDGPIPPTIGAGRWTYVPDFGAATGVLTSPAGGVNGGSTYFTVDQWGERSGPYTAVATYSNDEEPGSLTATIRVGFGPEPTLEWIPDPAAFGTTTILRLTVPRNSYAVGRRGIIADLSQFPPPFQTPPFPAGTTVVMAAGWSDVTDPQTGMTGFEIDSVAEGVYDFEYTLGAGTTAVSPGVILSVGAAIPVQADLSIVPA